MGPLNVGSRLDPLTGTTGVNGSCRRYLPMDVRCIDRPLHHQHRSLAGDWPSGLGRRTPPCRGDRLFATHCRPSTYSKAARCPGLASSHFASMNQSFVTSGGRPRRAVRHGRLPRGLHRRCAAKASCIDRTGLPIKAPWRLLPRRIGIQVPCQLHGVVQRPTDNDQAGLKTIDKKVTWSVDDPHTGFRVFPAQSQVPRSNTCTKFGPRETARSVGLACHVAQRGDDQALVTQSGDLTEALMCPSEDFEHIALCCFRQAIAKHQLAVLAACAARRPSCPTKSSS